MRCVSAYMYDVFTHTHTHTKSVDAIQVPFETVNHRHGRVHVAQSIHVSWVVSPHAAGRDEQSRFPQKLRHVHEPVDHIPYIPLETSYRCIQKTFVRDEDAYARDVSMESRAWKRCGQRGVWGVYFFGGV